MISFSPAGVDAQSLMHYEELFTACFSKQEKFSPAALRWLYADNPDGSVVGFDAYDGDILAAHYVCIPALIRVNGKLEKTLLSLNTATHPKYQGKGLFTKLAELTYRAGAELGYSSVYGVANANSTPGFMRKLGFQLVQQLSAKIGCGSLGVNIEMATQQAQFERVWSAESLAWRSANPGNSVQSQTRHGGIVLYASAFGKLLPAYAEISQIAGFQEQAASALSPLRLFLGLSPHDAGGYGRYMEIPQRFRPSPLNLIFRSLAASPVKLEAGHISFSFLDFDAY
ncbi:GNAT family N-acetyltransferase [Janthinobacterium lividum]|uniref:GNAT family N-acetyltransferase n=1 Tax=Janthinobacterium lividum TaxID=29581 RepID=A0A1E8PTZ4_9BURK|nr:GNAT family N-acetyltransferase [Janthinobacterium lividum]